MTSRLLATLPDAMRHWKRADARLHAAAKATPPKRVSVSRSSAFATLVDSILSQQVSVQAADTMYARLEARCGGRVRPEAVLTLGDEDLRACGLSVQKRAYVLDLAVRSVDGDVNFRRFPRMTDEAILEALTEVKGIGKWTGQMFLLFHLQRPDVVAPDDLGLQYAAMDLYGLKDTKGAKRFLADQAPVWSPHGSLACLTLWNHRRATMLAAKAARVG